MYCPKCNRSVRMNNEWYLCDGVRDMGGGVPSGECDFAIYSKTLSRFGVEELTEQDMQILISEKQLRKELRPFRQNPVTAILHLVKREQRKMPYVNLSLWKVIPYDAEGKEIL